jgi:putative glutamine amidotransferase
MRAGVTFGNEARLGPYLAALREAGIEAVGNPDSLDSLDGLLLTGGADINPKRYGQERGPETNEPDDDRDELEIRLLREALAADLPVLAICRGLQLFNVVCGGTLIQHLPSSDRHKQKSLHEIRVASNTRLAEIIGAGEHQVNSRHHQAVDRKADMLIESAVAPDGVIEALELPGAAFAVAVQWHPEDRIAVNPADRKLFEAFAAAMARPLGEHRAAPQTSS